MTTETPDPRTFKSWQDAFQYPVPVVRKFEQQLRKHDAENREKLRTLVGASYRDLLGTAERIIDMDERMQQVESNLSHMGQKCNTRAIERKARNYDRMKQHWKAQDDEHCALASQLSVLQSCPMVISRLLKKNDSRLLAAKVLVISRLLHKTLSQHPDAPPLLDTLRIHLGSLRRKLLKTIDKCIADTKTLPQSLIEDMCAFSLATSSTPTDVLKHFHHVRLEAITRCFQDEPKILLALNCFTRTLLDTQRIFPKRLADSLAELKERPLPKDQSVQAVTELNLDVHGRWIADEVRNFTPWPRHEELQKTEAEKILKAWAKQALPALLQGTRAALSDGKDLKTLVAVRKEILENWLPLSGRLPGINSATVLDELRQVINEQLSKVISDYVSGLANVSGTVKRTLETWEPGVTDVTISLWSPSMISIPLSNGAATFKQAILDRSSGRCNALNRVIGVYDRWVASVSAIQATIKKMKESRWDDFMLDDTAEEDEFGLDSAQALLAEDDPHTLDEALHEALTFAFERLVQQLEELVSQTLRSDPASSQHVTRQCVFLLRFLREANLRLAKLNLKSSDGTPALSSDRLVSLAPPLHYRLAIAAGQAAFFAYSDSICRLGKAKTIPARALWEGTPPLPVQPSPAVFRFLRRLVTDMSEYGVDIWTPGAVRALKNKIGQDSSAVIQVHLEDLFRTDDAVGEPNGLKIDGVTDDDGEHAEPDQAVTGQGPAAADTTATTAQLRRDKIIQLLFDMLYLQRAFSVANYSLSKNDLDGVVQYLEGRASLDGSAVERVRKSAADYWKRTYLLFALLA